MLVKNPFVDWLTALRNFNYHQCKYDVHTGSLLAMQIFVSVLGNEIKPISQTEDQMLENTVAKSRDKPAIIKYILICRQHSPPFSGHRYGCGYKYFGNFQALLDFRVDSCDKLLKQHFHTPSRNVTFRFKTIQNDLIHCCAEAPIQDILQEVRADEVKHCSNREKMPVI